MRKTWILAAAATAGLLLANFRADRLGAADDKVPTIEDIMQAVNKKKGGLHTDVSDALKMGTIDWDSVQTKTKQYSAMADFLGKNDPPKGSKSSWAKLTKTYADDAKALNAAAEKKDKATATSAIKKLSGECMGCHKVHRGM
jgi:cytochrome c556